jgi:hypothetical protein
MTNPLESSNAPVATGTPNNVTSEGGPRISVWNFAFLTLFVVFFVCAALLLVTHGRRVRLYQLIIMATEVFGLPISLVAMIQNVRHGNWIWFMLVLLAQLVMFICTAQYF